MHNASLLFNSWKPQTSLIIIGKIIIIITIIKIKIVSDGYTVYVRLFFLNLVTEPEIRGRSWEGKMDVNCRKQKTKWNLQSLDRTHEDKLESMSTSHRLNYRPQHTPSPGDGEAEGEIQGDQEVLLAGLPSCANRRVSRWVATCVLQKPPRHKEVWLLLYIHWASLTQNFSFGHTKLEPCRKKILRNVVPGWLNRISTTSLFTLWYADASATENLCTQWFLLWSLEPFTPPPPAKPQRFGNSGTICLLTRLLQNF